MFEQTNLGGSRELKMDGAQRIVELRCMHYLINISNADVNKVRSINILELQAVAMICEDHSEST